MKICTYNLLESGLGRIDPLAEVIRLSGAEVVVVQECWDSGLMRKLAERVGMDWFVAENPKNEEGATGVMTKWEIREAVNYALAEPRLTRSAFHVVLREKSEQRREKSEVGSEKIVGTEWIVVGLHLHARETVADEEVRLSELPAVLEIGEKLKARGEVVICGDFNTSHPGQVIDLETLRPSARERAMAQGGVVPREVISRMLSAGWVDAHAIGRRVEAFGTSFTTSAPGTRVDFIFISAGLVGRVRSCEVFKPEMARFASDHFPVVAEID